MMTVRKRVGPLPTHRLDVRHSVDYSSFDHFSLDDSSSSSSLETSSDSSPDALSDSASSHSSSDHSFPAPSSGMKPSHHLCSLVPSIHHSSAIFSARPSHDSSSASPSRKRSRSPAASIPLSSPIPRALSYVRADLLPSPKRISSSETAKRSDGIEIDPEIQAEIDECITYVDALRDRGIDARVVVEAVDRDEVGTDVRGPVKVRVDRVTYPVTADDIPKPAREEGVVDVTYETLGDLVQRFHDHTVEIHVHRVQAIESDHWMAEALRARDAIRILGPPMGDEGKQEEVNGNGGNGNREDGIRGNENRGKGNKGNGNGGNGNEGNGNDNGNG
nr:hypothetical protein [Tanacetum cinerariifolium]